MTRLCGIDPDSRQVRCANGQAFAFDALSLDVGSTPDLSSVPGASEHAVPVKPVPAILDAWRSVAAQCEARSWARPRIAVVGGGAGGVEIALAMRHRCQASDARQEPAISLVADGFLPTYARRVRLLMERALVDAPGHARAQGPRHARPPRRDRLHIRRARSGGPRRVGHRRVGPRVDQAERSAVRRSRIRRRERSPAVTLPPVGVRRRRRRDDGQRTAAEGRRLRCSPGPVARRQPRAIPGGRHAAALSGAAALPVVNLDWRPPCRRLLRRVVVAGALGVGVERSDRPAIHAEIQRLETPIEPCFSRRATQPVHGRNPPCLMNASANSCRAS